MALPEFMDFIILKNFKWFVLGVSVNVYGLLVFFVWFITLVCCVVAWNLFRGEQKGECMGYKRDDWARDFLLVLGNTAPTLNMVKWVVAWTLCETLAPEKALRPAAQFNLLNTHYILPGSWESHNGVQNYLTYLDGLRATVATLNDGSYPYLLSALALGEVSLLGFTTGVVNEVIVKELEKWSGGKGYGAQVFSLVGQGLDDIFAGENTYGREVAAERVWQSTAPLLMAVYGKPAPYYTNIALAWRELWLGGKQPGPPLTPLYVGNDDNRNEMGFQEFTNLHATINQDGVVELYTLTGQIPHPVKIYVPYNASLGFDGYSDAYSDGQPTAPQDVISDRLETPDRVVAQRHKPKRK